MPITCPHCGKKVFDAGEHNDAEIGRLEGKVTRALSGMKRRQESLDAAFDAIGLNEEQRSFVYAHALEWENSLGSGQDKMACTDDYIKDTLRSNMDMTDSVEQVYGTEKSKRFEEALDAKENAIKVEKYYDVMKSKDISDEEKIAFRERMKDKLEI